VEPRADLREATLRALRNPGMATISRCLEVIQISLTFLDPEDDRVVWLDLKFHIRITRRDRFTCQEQPPIRTSAFDLRLWFSKAVATFARMGNGSIRGRVKADLP
jgi:hypothetical protein